VGSRPSGDAPAAEPPASRRAKIDELYLQSGDRRDLRRMPRLIGEAFQLVRRAAPRELNLAVALQVAAGVSLAAQLLVLRRVLDTITAAAGIPNWTDVAPELMLLGALLVVVALATTAQREQRRVLAELVQKHTTGRVMDVSTRVDLIEYDRPGFYDALERARVNASMRPVQIATGVLGLLGGGVAVAAVGTTLLVIEPLVVLVIVLGGVPAVLLNRASARVLHQFHVRQTPMDRRRQYLYTVLSRKEEAQEVRAFSSGGYLRTEHDQLYDDKVADLRGTVRRRMFLGAVAGLVAATVTVGAVALLLAFVQTGRLSVGDAAVAVGAVVLLAGQVRGLVGSSGSLYEGALFLEDFTRFVARRPRDKEVARPGSGNDGSTPTGRIELHGVSFTYPSRVEPSLREVNLTIERGEVIALVGENGSGKTTLTKLLAGLYRPSDGRIVVGGQDVTEADLSTVRDGVTVIFQDYARYFMTAHENIAISSAGRIEERERVRDAARRAGVADFIERLPEGFDSLLGPSFIGGSDLSVGQWQRVALARAYFRDAPMLILDEPTAALDPRGEVEIFEQVRSLAQGRTVILVTHRFSSVRVADRILVLRSGRIVEDGRHADLLAAEGLYAELFRMQAAGYAQE
jgi:ATP-binding cassette, subfamily B, bacterial